jgi:hypothetical protein
MYWSRMQAGSRNTNGLGTFSLRKSFLLVVSENRTGSQRCITGRKPASSQRALNGFLSVRTRRSVPTGCLRDALQNNAHFKNWFPTGAGHAYECLCDEFQGALRKLGHGKFVM